MKKQTIERQRRREELARQLVEEGLVVIARNKNVFIRRDGKVFSVSSRTITQRQISLRNNIQFVTITKNRIKRTLNIHDLVANAFLPLPTSKKSGSIFNLELIDGDKSNVCVGNLRWVGKTISVHILVATAFTPKPLTKYRVKLEVNHKDGNTANNNSSNLEWITHMENMVHAINKLQNNREVSKCGVPASGYTGVVKSGNQFSATIGINGKKKYLGVFITAMGASLAYQEALERSFKNPKYRTTHAFPLLITYKK